MEGRCMTLTAGVDFGGTLVKVGLVSDTGRIVAEQALDTTAARGPAAFIAMLTGAISRLAGEAGVPARRLRGVGIGAPGLVQRGIVRRMVNVPGWRDIPLQRLIERALRCPCRIDNDANLAALGEWRFGAGRGTQDMVAVTLGTGVGGGLVIGGRLLRGADGAAGEIGHMVVDPGGPRCGCGRRGCLEAHVGTAGILRQARAARLIARGRLTPRMVSDAAAAGSPAARRVWERTGWWLGLGLANVVNLVNPERIVIGGGVAGAWPWFAPSMTASLKTHAVFAAASSVRVVRARLGPQAGVVGAAVLLWMES
jgi:glucokinase